MKAFHTMPENRLLISFFTSVSKKQNTITFQDAGKEVTKLKANGQCQGILLYVCGLKDWEEAKKRYQNQWCPCWCPLLQQVGQLPWPVGHTPHLLMIACFILNCVKINGKQTWLCKV